MTTFQKFSLFLLRIAMGWLMFYAGITKILDPNWSAAEYLTGLEFCKRMGADAFRHFFGLRRFCAAFFCSRRDFDAALLFSDFAIPISQSVLLHSGRAYYLHIGASLFGEFARRQNLGIGKLVLISSCLFPLPAASQLAW